MAIDFLDSDNAFVDCENATAIQNIFASPGGTVMAWIFARDFSIGGGDGGRIMDKEGPDTDGGWYWFLDSTGPSAMEMRFVHDLVTNDAEFASPDDSLNLDTWHHVVLQYDKSGAPSIFPLMYIDGESVSVNQIGSNVGAAVDDSSFPLYIGNRYRLGLQFDGLIADARMYDTIISAEEIKNIYAMRGTDVPSSGLVRRWTLSPVVPGVGIKTPWLDQIITTQGGTEDEVAMTNVTSVTGETLVMIVSTSGKSSSVPVLTDDSTDWDNKIFNLGTPSTSSTPAIAMWTKTSVGGSEPSTYTVSSDILQVTFGGVIINMGTMSLDLVGSVTSTTGTSDTPSCPSNTAGESVLTFRICCVDGLVQPTRDQLFFTDMDCTGLAAIQLSSAAGNGATMGVSIETQGALASGTRDYSPSASEQWVATTVSFGYGDGLELPPATDHSSDQDGAYPKYPTIGAADILRIKG